MSYKGFDLIKSAQKMGAACTKSYNGKHDFRPSNGNIKSPLACKACGLTKL